MWVLIALAGLGSMAVLAIGATLGAGRYDGRHALPDVQEEYDAWVAGQGSMILAEEHPLEPLPAPVVDAHPWLEQTAADLAPEVLGMCEHGWPGDTCGQAHPYMAAPTPVHDHTVDEHGELLHACRACLADAGLWDEREEIVLPAYGGWISGPCLDPGPGDAAVEPPASPGPDQPSRWLEEQMAILFDWVREQHARGALA